MISSQIKCKRQLEQLMHFPVTSYAKNCSFTYSCLHFGLKINKFERVTEIGR